MPCLLVQAGKGEFQGMIFWDEKVGWLFLEVKDFFTKDFCCERVTLTACLDLALDKGPDIVFPGCLLSGHQGGQLIPGVPGGKGKIAEIIFFPVRPGKGIKAVPAAIIVATVSEDTQGNPALDLLVPDMIGNGNGLWQNELGHTQKEQGNNDTGPDDRGCDFF